MTVDPTPPLTHRLLGALLGFVVGVAVGSILVPPEWPMWGVVTSISALAGLSAILGYRAARFVQYGDVPDARD